MEGRGTHRRWSWQGWAPRVKVVYSAFTLDQSYLCSSACDGLSLSHRDFSQKNKKQLFKNNLQPQIWIMYMYHIQPTLGQPYPTLLTGNNSIIYLEGEGEWNSLLKLIYIYIYIWIQVVKSRVYPWWQTPETWGQRPCLFSLLHNDAMQKCQWRPWWWAPTMWVLIDWVGSRHSLGTTWVILMG